MLGEAPGLLMLKPRTGAAGPGPPGPPIDALGDARAGVIWVLLLETPGEGPLSLGDVILPLPGSLSRGTGRLFIVFDLSTPADLGPSARSASMDQSSSGSVRVDPRNVLLGGITGGTVAERRRFGGALSNRSGRSRYSPAGEMPAFRRAAPEKVVPRSPGSLDATSFYHMPNLE